MKERQSEPNFKSTYGLKQGYAITAMPFGALLDAQNVTLDGLGGKFTRRGYKFLFSIPGNIKVEALLDYTKTNTIQETLAFAGTSIWTRFGSTATVVRSGVAASHVWQWLVYKDEVYGVNGMDRSFKYNGATEVAISITPLANPTLGVNAGGTLPVGAIQYVATLFDSARGAESNPPSLLTAPSATTSAGNQTIRITRASGAANEGYTHWRIYRLKPGETLFTRIAEVPYATTFFDDTGIPTGSIVIETDNGQPDTGNTPHPQSKIILLYDDVDRMLMVDESNPTLLCWSKQGLPHAWPSANAAPIGRQDGNRILSLKKIGSAVLIEKRSGTWILDGDPKTTIARRVTSLGTQDFYTSAVAENFSLRLTSKGFYNLIPTEHDVLDLRDQYVGTDVIDRERTLAWGDTPDIRTFTYRKGTSKHIYFFFPSKGLPLTPVLVYDFNIVPGIKDTNEWIPYVVNTDVHCVADYQENSESLMIFGDGYGMVWRWDYGETDGSNLDALLLNGTSTGGNTTTTLNDTTKSWVVDELKGLVVRTIEGLGGNQYRRIISNTATQITVQNPWSVTPDISTVYTIAAIDSWGEEFWNSNNLQDHLKRMRWITPNVRQTGNFPINVSFRRDFRSGIDNTRQLSLQVSSSESLWGVLIWGIDTWGQAASTQVRLRFSGKYKYYTIKYRSQKSAQRFYWDGHGSSFQVLTDRTG